MEVSAAIDIEVPEYRLYEQFQEAAIANSGQVFFLFEKTTNRGTKKTHDATRYDRGQ